MADESPPAYAQPEPVRTLHTRDAPGRAPTLGDNQRIALITLSVLGLDQLTKGLIVSWLALGDEWILIHGFFKLVHWGNTGAAWSLFRGYNEWLAIVALLALLGLFLTRHHFSIHTSAGQFAVGLVFAGIVGNLIDRLRYDHVVDFIYFYIVQRGSGNELGFPAFNVADAAICTGVGLLFLLSWQNGVEGQTGPA
jgi:signal peptidase II